MPDRAPDSLVTLLRLVFAAVLVASAGALVHGYATADAGVDGRVKPGTDPPASPTAVPANTTGGSAEPRSTVRLEGLINRSTIPTTTAADAA